MMVAVSQAAGGSTQHLYLRWYRRLRVDLWFPHVPLALAVGGAGTFALLPTIRKYAAQYLHLDLAKLQQALHPISGQIPPLILSGVPRQAERRLIDPPAHRPDRAMITR